MTMRHLTKFLPVGRTSSDSSETKPSAFVRVQDHVDELRRFFELPEDELFLDEFYCALAKRILLQGRMYIFEHHLCFYSNVFGWIKQKVIPLHKIKQINKKRNYGFPNSIEVVWKKKEFFTSFLNRNDAYELLCDAVKHSQSLDVDTEGMSKGDAASSPSSQSLASGTAKRDRGSEQDYSDLEENDDEIDVFSISCGSAPPVPENMAMICEDSFDVSVKEFFFKTLSTDSMFLDEYHKTRGDSRFRVSEWEQIHGIVGLVRQATFVSPVKGPRIGFISPKNTECTQDHRLSIHDGEHLVFQISQVMKDIPYGDNFSVEMRWDVKPMDDGGCQISIYVAVLFIRSVMAPFRSMIESNVMKEMSESVKLMVDILRDTCCPEPPMEEVENNNPSSRVLTKLSSVLSDGDGLQKLEQIVENSDALLNRSAETNIAPVHQTTTTMNVQQPFGLTNWIMLCFCLLMLICQVLLVSMSIPRVQESQGIKAADEMRLLEIERTLNSAVRMLQEGANQGGTFCQNVD